jgi:hypothetical protein
MCAVQSTPVGTQSGVPTCSPQFSSVRPGKMKGRYLKCVHNRFIPCDANQLLINYRETISGLSY